MEVSGIHTQEIVQFASVLHKCGSELTDIGTFLKEKACEITSTHQSARKSAVSSTVSTSDKSAECSVGATALPSKTLSDIPKMPEKHKHKHFYEIPIATPSKHVVVYNEEISKIPKPKDDDRNSWHNPSKWKLMCMKQEVPSCSSNEDSDDPTHDDVDTVPMGPVKPGKKPKKNIKGLYACEVCGQDYTNCSDLANHTAQHAGVMYTCIEKVPVKEII